MVAGKALLELLGSCGDLGRGVWKQGSPHTESNKKQHTNGQHFAGANQQLRPPCPDPRFARAAEKAAGALVGGRGRPRPGCRPGIWNFISCKILCTHLALKMIETSVFEACLVEPNSTLREFFCKNRTAFDNPLFQSPGCLPYSRLFSPSYGFGFNHPNVENLKLESENFGKEVSCSFHNWHFLTDSFFSLDTDDWVERYQVEFFNFFKNIFFFFENEKCGRTKHQSFFLSLSNSVGQRKIL